MAAGPMHSERPCQTAWVEVLLTHITGTCEEVNHEGGLSQVGQDGVMHSHQHLLVEAEGQL